jgi:putative peptidoglycan lipid II flippase
MKPSPVAHPPADSGTSPVVRKPHNLTVATVIMMIGLMLSKVSGHLREILVVPILGYGVVSDAYIIGFQIPDLFYQLLIGGAIQAAITPSLAAAIEQNKERKGWRSISIFINYAALVMLVAVVAGELLAPVLIPIYNHGKLPEITTLAVSVARALFPQVFFMMLAALSIGILNAYRKFGSTSFGPTVYNICVVLAMVFLGSASPSGAVRVAAGVMGSAAIYFIMQFYLARREFRNYTFSFDYRDRGFQRLLHLALPTLLSGSIVQINTIILTSFADQFPGAATSLRNAATTWQLPYGIFAVAIGNVMLPSLAGLYATHNLDGCRKLYTQSLRRALFLIIPSAALFLAMQQDVIQAIFQWGSRYTSDQVVAAASVLRWYCLAMVAQTVVFMTNQAFYARKMTRIALLNGLLTLLLNPLFCLLLLRVFKMDISGLSLAYTITSFFSAFFLYFIYKRSLPEAAPRHIYPYLVRIFFCVSLLILGVLGLNLLPFHPAGKMMQLVWLGVRTMAGLLIFVMAAAAINLPEVQLILRPVGKLRRRLHRKR